MTTQRPDERPALEAEHKILKQQVAELRYDHNRLQRGGGTKEERRQHIHKLRAKIRELEQHVARLKRLRGVEGRPPDGQIYSRPSAFDGITPRGGGKFGHSIVTIADDDPEH